MFFFGLIPLMNGKLKTYKSSVDVEGDKLHVYKCY